MGTLWIILAWAAGVVVFLKLSWWILRIGGSDSSWFRGGGSGSI